jgi:hypothetical protein
MVVTRDLRRWGNCGTRGAQSDCTVPARPANNLTERPADSARHHHTPTAQGAIRSPSFQRYDKGALANITGPPSSADNGGRRDAQTGRNECRQRPRRSDQPAPALGGSRRSAAACSPRPQTLRGGRRVRNGASAAVVSRPSEHLICAHTASGRTRPPTRLAMTARAVKFSGRGAWAMLTWQFRREG